MESSQEKIYTSILDDLIEKEVIAERFLSKKKKKNDLENSPHEINQSQLKKTERKC